MSEITFSEILPQADRQYYNMLNDYDKDILEEEYPRTYLKNGAILFIPEDIYWLAKAIFWEAGPSDEARRTMAWEIRSYRESQEGPTYKDVVSVPGEYSPEVTNDDLLKETIRDDAQWESWDRTVWIATDVAGAPDFDNPIKQGGEVEVKRGEKIIKMAGGWIGTPYKKRGSSKTGVDCSHLVHEVYKEAGLAYPYVWTTALPSSEYFTEVNKPIIGDVVLILGKNNHMGIYNPNKTEGNTLLSATESGGVRYGKNSWFPGQVRYFRFIGKQKD